PGEPLVAEDCNCSICTLKGFVHWIVPAERFALLSGADVLTEYRFGTGVARHLFCRVCGIHVFFVPRSHPDGFDVDVRWLVGDPGDRFEIRPFDGRHWEANVHRLRDG